MNYIMFIIRLITFAITLFFALEFIIVCDMDNWKAAGIFIGTSVLIIFVFFITKQHALKICPVCKTKISPIKDNGFKTV